MRIDQLHLENFKKFAEHNVDLHPRFNLLVGENGAGKTTLLDALAVASGIWLVEPPDTTLVSSGRNILPAEVRLEPQPKGDRVQFQERRPVIVRATGRIGENEGVSWVRQIRPDGIRTTNADAQEALRRVKEVYAQDAAGQNVLCPVLAYYGAGRAWLPSNARVPASKPNGPARRWAAFYDCFNERIRFSEIQKWFSRETTERGNRGGKSRPGFEVVRQAVLRCVPGADNVWFDTDRDEIVLSIRGNAQPFGNLSAGQRMMLALVADLAIKAVTQNAFLLPPDALGAEDDPLPRVMKLTPGVVLIDELDVHLHPAWQRRVASDLKQNFPNIQFVCTSHSPQVIGEVSQEEVRVLRETATELPMVAYGADSNWILEHVMNAQQRSDRATQMIRAVEDGLEEGDIEAAKNGLHRLRALVGGEEGEVARLEGSIRNMEALADEKD
jgi:predicted ATP-binding protein involved in virulence